MPYPSSFIVIFLLFIFLFIHQRNNRMMLQKILKKRKTEDSQMFELAQKFIGTECIIYTFNAQLTGVVKAVNEGGLLLEKNGATEAVNLDFIVRIREYPRKKNGKKKSVIFD